MTMTMTTQFLAATDGNDIITVLDTQVTGGTFDGMGGTNDVLQLSGSTSLALSFDFTKAQSLVNFETIRGTATTDYITLTSQQLGSISTFQSGGDRYYDFLQIKGATVDMRSKTLDAEFKVSLLDNNATVTVNSMATALALRGNSNLRETLVLEGITLQASERESLHNSTGFDVIVDASGISSTDLAPQLSGLAGDRVTVLPNQPMFIDIGANATIVDERPIKELNIELSNWFSDFDTLSIDTTGNIALVPTTFDEKVFVNNTEIGTLRRSNTFNTLDFSFNQTATNVLIQELVHAITFKYSGSHLPYGSNEVIVEVVDSGNRKTTSNIALVYQNDAPTEITLTSSAVMEGSGTSTIVGKITALDGNENDVVRLTLLDNAGGRFSLDWAGNLRVADGTKLDYEQAKSHTITVRATDRGGLTLDKTFVISVTDGPDGGLITSGPQGISVAGTPGKDTLRGTAADETFLPGLSADVLTGGAGKDIFVFNTKPGTKNVDKITDFRVVDDSIHLENSIFKALGKKNGILKKTAFWNGTKAHDSSDRIVYDKKIGALYYDEDGSGAKRAIKFATINKVALNEKDFYIV